MQPLHVLAQHRNNAAVHRAVAKMVRQDPCAGFNAARTAVSDASAFMKAASRRVDHLPSPPPSTSTTAGASVKTTELWQTALAVVTGARSACRDTKETPHSALMSQCVRLMADAGAWRQSCLAFLSWSSADARNPPSAWRIIQSSSSCVNVNDPDGDTHHLRDDGSVFVSGAETLQVVDVPSYRWATAGSTTHGLLHYAVLRAVIEGSSSDAAVTSAVFALGDTVFPKMVPGIIGALAARRCALPEGDTSTAGAPENDSIADGTEIPTASGDADGSAAHGARLVLPGWRLALHLAAVHLSRSSGLSLVGAGLAAAVEKTQDSVMAARLIRALERGSSAVGQSTRDRTNVVDLAQGILFDFLKKDTPAGGQGAPAHRSTQPANLPKAQAGQQVLSPRRLQQQMAAVAGQDGWTAALRLYTTNTVPPREEPSPCGHSNDELIFEWRCGVSALRLLSKNKSTSSSPWARALKGFTRLRAQAEPSIAPSPASAVFALAVTLRAEDQAAFTLRALPALYRDHRPLVGTSSTPLHGTDDEQMAAPSAPSDEAATPTANAALLQDSVFYHRVVLQAMRRLTDAGRYREAAETMATYLPDYDRVVAGAAPPQVQGTYMYTGEQTASSASTIAAASRVGAIDAIAAEDPEMDLTLSFLAALRAHAHFHCEVATALTPSEESATSPSFSEITGAAAPAKVVATSSMWTAALTAYAKCASRLRGRGEEILEQQRWWATYDEHLRSALGSPDGVPPTLLMQLKDVR